MSDKVDVDPISENVDAASLYSSSLPCILKVAVFTPLRRLFDYLPDIPSPNADNADYADTHPFKPGMRVSVPFGKQTAIGIIVEITNKSDCPTHQLKRINGILDRNPLLSESHLKLILWASHYYQCPVGEVFETALPPKLRKIESQNMKNQETTENSVNGIVLDYCLNSNSDYCLNSNSDYSLNEDQVKAVDAIYSHINTYKSFLLDGVTGSGKTEVYLTLSEKILRQDPKAQILIIVPEIGLTPQILHRFQERFSGISKNISIALLHSSLSEKKRSLAWEAAQSGRASIIIGTRSAAFVPLKNPKLFIVDEEHDMSLKQQEGFRYSGRDVLVKRAFLENCPIVLGSATPSLETLHNALSGRYERLRLKMRAGQAKPPLIKVLDIRHKKLKGGLSAQLLASIRTHLEKDIDKGQVLLFLNRRGFAPVLMCFDCGFYPTCRYCDAKLIVHNQKQTLQCHHCDSRIALYKTCPSCQSTAIKPLGIGTERIENTLLEEFPNANIVRLDKDTTRKKNVMENALEKIISGETDIILGTQMIAKGHHFPNLSLVAIVDIDSALFSTDFRSTERMGQLFMQVAGRAGRAAKLGEVILQTCHPMNPLLNHLIAKGYHDFAELLLAERKTVHLPPFSYQVLIRAEAKTLDRAMKFLEQVKHLIKAKLQITVMGPTTAPLEKRRGNFHAQLLLQSSKRSYLQSAMQGVVEVLGTKNSTIARGVRWSMDVDPQEMF